MKSNKTRHVGLHAWRKRRYAEEKRFADAWKRWNNVNPDTGLPELIDDLLTKECQPISGATDDQTIAAATVVQWLGSPVGQQFLKELGYEKAHGKESKEKARVRAHQAY